MAFLKGKISGIESTVAMVSSNPPIENRKPESSTEYTQSRVVANSNKPEEECRKAFHEMCQESGGPDKCGPGMMHHKMGRKGK